MKKTIFLGLLAVLAMCFVSCDDDNELPKSKLTVEYKIPENLDNFKAIDMVLNVYNGTSGQTIKFNLPIENDVIIEEGVYTFSIEGKCEYTVTKDGKTEKINSSVKGIKDNEIVKGNAVSVNIPLFVSDVKSGFVFEEIFFAGTLTPEGEAYRPDNFFEIYNNTDKVLYADGLSIGETKFKSTMKYNYTPDIRSEGVAVSAIYTIPGDGDDYPVQPGESLLICDVATNHKESNINSFDLSKADFEWYNDDERDVDVPEVPNLITVMSGTKTVWAPNNQGNTSFVLFRMEKLKEEFFIENKYAYEYDMEVKGKVYHMSRKTYQIPNSWVIDAVALSIPSKHLWMLLDPSLDFNYTHSGDNDEESYGRSVRRKVAYTTADGRKVLMDSNNSAVDFIPTAEPTPGTVE
jgi:hypothetical protein